MIRRDFFEIVELLDRPRHRREVLHQRRLHRPTRRPAAWPAMDYLDIQISLDGLDAATNDPVRGDGSLRHRPAGDGPPRRRRLRAVQDLGRRHPPQRRPARRVQGAGRRRTAPSCGSPGCGPSGRGADTWHDLHPTNDQQRQIYHWLLGHPNVLTGDSFFHLNALGEPLPGLNMCGAGRVVCLIDPIGDVYACPFVIHDEFQAGSVRDAGRLRRGVAARASCSWRCASRSRPARAPRAAATTPARAAAWRPSSSSACRSTAPTPSASTATAPSCWPASTGAATPAPGDDHSKPAPVTFTRKPVSAGR